MSQKILNVRVRPSRVAVLIGTSATRDELNLALTFLSRLWGGRFCQLLPVEPGNEDRLALFRLSQSRPDFVYGIGIDHATYPELVGRACQPRGYGPLEAEYVEKLHDSIEEHVTASHIIRHVRKSPGSRGRERTLWLQGCDPESPLYPFVGALFGFHYPNLSANVLPHEEGWIRRDVDVSVADYVACHAQMVRMVRRFWLDFTSHDLSPRITGWGEHPPTIVLVDQPVKDFAWFWNLRAATDPAIPAWLIPIPAAAADDPTAAAALKEWVLAFEPYQRQTNFARVTSVSVPPDRLSDFAQRLQAEFQGTHIEHVDVWEPTARLPLVIAQESEHHLPVEARGRRLTFRLPRPKLLEGVSRGSWVVDLVEDVRTKRAVMELCLPSRLSSQAVLNAPAPPSIQFTVITRLGYGQDSVNWFCSGKTEITHIYLPTAAEILEEVLREAEIVPARDEKRACYAPVMRLFGGLEKTAQALTGQRGLVLRELAKGPILVSELLGRAKLGKGKLKELAPPEMLNEILARCDPISQRVAHRRFRESRDKTSPTSTGVESLLEFWADKGIVTRLWQLPRCDACLGTFWEPELRIARPVRCPGCGTRLRLPPLVPLGYSLHRLVRHAIEQGITTVAMTGRFLRSLTHDGFLWLPGVKYRWKGVEGDLDLIACCDGHLVVGECKSLETTPSDAGAWNQVLEQFRTTVELARAVRAEVVVLSALAEAFPDDFRANAQEMMDPSMRLLLLDRQDLEKGRRMVDVPGSTLKVPLRIDDLIPDPMPEVPWNRPPEPRVLRTPYYIFTF